MFKKQRNYYRQLIAWTFGNFSPRYLAEDVKAEIQKEDQYV